MRAVVHLLYGPHHTDFSLLFGIDSKPTWSWLNRWLCIWEATEELEISTSNTLTCFYTPTYWRFCRCQTRPWRRGRRSWLWPSCASCWGAAGAGACAVAWRAAWRQPGCRTCLASNAFSTATSSSSPTTEHDPTSPSSHLQRIKKWWIFFMDIFKDIDILCVHLHCIRALTGHSSSRKVGTLLKNKSFFLNCSLWIYQRLDNFMSSSSFNAI